MAARPVAALVALALPSRDGLELAKSLYEGMLPLAENFGVAIAGGDTNSWDGPLVISVTAIGETIPRGVWTRSGAQPGDAIIVTGSLGGSILGRHLDVKPRVLEALWIAERYKVNAAIDVSDGLARDLWHLCEESGCGAEVHDSAVPISPAAKELAERPGDNRSPLEHAYGDGEDFELILAMPQSEADRLLGNVNVPVWVSRIGTFVADRGLWRLDSSGERRELPPLGFEHHFK
jgi:thiamine-monophosphate kinase